jgi:toxin ParE1/3/4
VTLGYLVRPKADRDIDAISDGLVERAANLDLGLRFITVTYETFALLAVQPMMGWSCRLPHLELKTARVFRVGEPFEKYLIFYRPYRDRIEILRVLHGAQDLELRLSSEGVI